MCSAIRCTRQAWLQERVASGPSGEKALLGSMMHELLQRSLRAALTGKLDRDEMMTEVRGLVGACLSLIVKRGPICGRGSPL